MPARFKERRGSDLKANLLSVKNGSFFANAAVFNLTALLKGEGAAEAGAYAAGQMRFE
jgi:hypothetical protein